MIHKCRVLKLVTNTIVVTDFGEHDDNWDYQNQPLPPGIGVNDVSDTGYCDHSALDGVKDRQAQVDVQNSTVVVNTGNTTALEQRQADQAAAKAVLDNLDADPFDYPTNAKPYLQALRDIAVGKPLPN